MPPGMLIPGCARSAALSDVAIVVKVGLSAGDIFIGVTSHFYPTFLKSCCIFRQCDCLVNKKMHE